MFGTGSPNIWIFLFKLSKKKCKNALNSIVFFPQCWYIIYPYIHKCICINAFQHKSYNLRQRRKVGMIKESLQAGWGLEEAYESMSPKSWQIASHSLTKSPISLQMASQQRIHSNSSINWLKSRHLTFRFSFTECKIGFLSQNLSLRMSESLSGVCGEKIGEVKSNISHTEKIYRPRRH